jgi:antitoxin HigA-1
MEMAMMKKDFAPVTPGEMLKEEFLAEYGLSQNQLAKAIGISPNRIAEIVNNRRRITADTALRLSLYFGNSPEFWMNLQSHYDLKMARSDLKPEDIKRIAKLGSRIAGRFAKAGLTTDLPELHGQVPRSAEFGK